MSPTPGYVFRDSGTTPVVEKGDPANNEFRQRITAATKPVTATAQAPLGQETSTSHQLATAEHDIRGAAQEAGEIEPNKTTNLGWQANGVDTDKLVGGLDNDDLWTLVRRFNKQLYHVKAIPQAPPGGLDLYIADEDDFSPDKLRASIERLYMTVIVGVITAAKHVVRLRSWREPRRTAIFATVWFVAWALNLLMPATFAALIVLITVPESRGIMFPPAPLALVNSHTGGVQSPPAGVLGSQDSVTGAPEKYKGEAVEQEASNLVNGIASVAISSAAGRHDQANPDEQGGSKALDAGAPDPTKMATTAADAATSATGGDAAAEHDKTKQPMEQAMWSKMRPAMHALGDISDGWERFANALSPTPPFSQQKRLQLAAIVAPLFLASIFIKIQWIYRSVSFFSGVAFFSDPLIQRGIQLLNEKVPDWPKYLEIRNTLMKGVPTNAQLTITLLRIGEANRAPLPPPPSSKQPLADEPVDVDKEKLLEESNLDASHSEVEDAITVDEPSGAEGDAASPSASTKKKGGFGSKIVSALRHTTAGAVETKLATDRGRAAAGSSHARDHLGILRSRREATKHVADGPVCFPARCNGKRGAVYIDASVSPPSNGRPASPCIYFSTDRNENEEVDEERKPPVWAVAIADVAEVKKLGGLGWKGKIVVGWATQREVKDGMEITVRDDDGKLEAKGGKGWWGKKENQKVFRATAMSERDECFNRVISMGQQVWESY